MQCAVLLPPEGNGVDICGLWIVEVLWGSQNLRLGWVFVGQEPETCALERPTAETDLSEPGFDANGGN